MKTYIQCSVICVRTVQQNLHIKKIYLYGTPFMYSTLVQINVVTLLPAPKETNVSIPGDSKLTSQDCREHGHEEEGWRLGVCEVVEEAAERIPGKDPESNAAQHDALDTAALCIIRVALGDDAHAWMDTQKTRGQTLTGKDRVILRKGHA